MKYWQYMEGKYEPQSPKLGKFFTIGLHDRQIHDVLRNQKCKILCINDTENIGDFRQQKRNIKDSFESILPEKSAFELSYKDSGGMYDKKVRLKKYTERLGFFGMILHYIGRFMTKNRAAGHWKADCAFWKSKEKPACV